jgi:hypothetical protein
VINIKGRDYLGGIVNNIKVDVREIGREEVDWIQLSQDRVHEFTELKQGDNSRTQRKGNVFRHKPLPEDW